MLSPFAASESSGMLACMSARIIGAHTNTGSPGQHAVHLLADNLPFTHDILRIGIQVGVEVVLRRHVSWSGKGMKRSLCAPMRI